MNIINFDNFSIANFFPASFNGGHDQKYTAFFDNKKWMVKRSFHAKYDRQRINNEKLPTFDSSCQSEWLGSRIYEMLGIPVQKTEYGKYLGRDVIACSFIYNNSESLVEIRGMLGAWGDEFSLKYSPGLSKVDFYDLQNFFYTDRRIQGLRNDIIQRFWDMFIVDAFIGNHDRHMGNWGIIRNENTGAQYLAPVYDNGSSFHCRWNEEQFRTHLKDSNKEFISVLLGGATPYVVNKKRINALKYIWGNPCRECVTSMEKIIPNININTCFSLIGELYSAKLITLAREKFLKRYVEGMYNIILFPALKNIQRLKNQGHLFPTYSDLFIPPEKASQFIEKDETSENETTTTSFFPL